MASASSRIVFATELRRSVWSVVDMEFVRTSTFYSEEMQ